MYLEFLGPDGSVQPWDMSFVTAVHVIGAFGAVPSFGKYCGIGKAVVLKEATAPVPWVHTYHVDWTWNAVPDVTDLGFIQTGTWWNQTDPQPTVGNYQVVGTFFTQQTPVWSIKPLLITELPGGFMSSGGPSGTGFAGNPGSFLNDAPGFRRRYGYFQAVGKFSSKSWSSFWLAMWKNSTLAPQIDVVDSYGGDNKTYYAILHKAAGTAGDVTNTRTAITTTTNLSAAVWRSRRRRNRTACGGGGSNSNSP